MARTRRGRRLLVPALTALCVAGAIVGGAVAAFPDTDVATYTGCVNPGGQIRDVALGNDPRKPCSSNEQLIHLSGGDITNVVPGPGLTGGGENGSVTLGLAAGHTLPQACASGQVPKSDGSGWACGDDADTDDAADVWSTEGKAFLNQGDEATLATLSLPPGSYYIIATGTTHNVQSGNLDVGCTIRVGPNTITGAGTAHNESDGRSLIPLAMSAVYSSPEAFDAVLDCDSFEDSDHVSMDLTAIRIGTLTEQ